MKLRVPLLLLLHIFTVAGFSVLPTTTSSNTQQGRFEDSIAVYSTREDRLPRSPILDCIPDAFQPFFDGIVNATALRPPEESNQAHDSFRYEWGTWVNEANLEYMMELLDTIQLQPNSYQQLLETPSSSRSASSIRYNLGRGEYWDCILHVLPEGTSYTGRHPTGAWSVLRPLLGQTELFAVSGPDANGNYKPRGTIRKLRGGVDTNRLAGSRSTMKATCIKYVGGPLRQYRSQYGTTVLIEVTVRPPIRSILDTSNLKELPIRMDEILCIVEAKEESDDLVQSPPASAMDISDLTSSIGISFDNVGGLDVQLQDIARRVLASRANPELTRKLGISHVKGILLSGPPGCGKTLLARELARLLGAREPQIVNGPEILDRFIGEAERKVRELFAPAEEEYKISGDKSALHIIILDEMDAIAKKRGSMGSDTTGVRDSVVNQLLAKMDGVSQASNVLVVGLTNRPELLDPALLRPGRLEVQLRIELPDAAGRRDILRIHTRTMKESNGLGNEAVQWIEDLGETGLAAATDHFSGAELAGLVRSAASFALARALESKTEIGTVDVLDLKKALREVRPALGRQDEVLEARFPLGISSYSSSMERILRDLDRFTAPIRAATPRLQSLLLVGSGRGGAGVTALAANAAFRASIEGSADYVRFLTALDILTEGSGDGEGVRAAALIERFAEAREMSSALLVLDDIDQLCAGTGQGGYSSVMLATLRALLRTPPSISSSAKAGVQSSSPKSGKTIQILATTSRSDAACITLHELFDETIVVPMLQDVQALTMLLKDTFSDVAASDAEQMSETMINRVGQIPCKTALRLVERACNEDRENPVRSLQQILDDFAGDEVTAEKLCEVL